MADLKCQLQLAEEHHPRGMVADGRGGEAQDDCMQWWARIMSSVPFSVLLVDEDHRIVSHNEAVGQRLVGRVLCGGNCCPQEGHGTEGPCRGCPLEAAVQTGTSQELELYDEVTGRWTVSSIFPTAVHDVRGRRLFLHWARDITEQKLAAQRLDQALEFHMALGELSRSLQVAETEEDVIAQWVDLALSLSWMDVTIGAVAFIKDGVGLRLVVTRQVDASVARQCARVALGDCICGGAALTKPNDRDAPISCRGVGHEHEHAAFPLSHEGRVLGVVTFHLQKGRKLSPHQTEFLRSAAQVTAASVAERAARREAKAEAARATVLEKELLKRVIASQEDERARIARELHDDLGQALSALLLELQSPSTSSAPSRRRDAELEQSIRGIIDRLYRLAWDLRPPVLDDLGLNAALSRFVTRVAEHSNLAFDYKYVGPRDARLSPDVEVCLYRLAQEAVNNVVKHANARHVSVLVFHRTDSVSLLVEDDGCGFEESHARTSDDGVQGLGMRSMRERAVLLNGELVVESNVKEGTSIRATIPM